MNNPSFDEQVRQFVADLVFRLNQPDAFEAKIKEFVATHDPGRRWKPVEECVVRDGREVLAALHYPYGMNARQSWVVFVARAYPDSHGGIQAPKYAKPTHFCELPIPEKPDGD